MKKVRKRGWLDARHQARRLAALVAHRRRSKVRIIAGAFFGAIIAAAIGGFLIWSGGQ